MRDPRLIPGPRYFVIVVGETPDGNAGRPTYLAHDAQTYPLTCLLTLARRWEPADEIQARSTVTVMRGGGHPGARVVAVY